MFVSFLYPFRLRGRVAPYLWIAYKQMTDLSPDDLCFIASDDYFADPERYKAQKRFECSWPENRELGFRVPDHPHIRAYGSHSVPGRIYERLKRALLADSLVWLRLIKEADQELLAFFLDTLEHIARSRDIEGIFTWCNCASLEEAGRQAGIPVIHTELGPLRRPWYRPLGYLDFSGVNGNTEAATRFTDHSASSPQTPPEAFSHEQLLALFSRQAPSSPATTAPEFQLGIPLQVEDDSNVLAYGRGFDLPMVVQYAQESVPDEALLLRPHPGSNLRASGKGLTTDDSETSMEFVRRCRGLLTLNSSVAIEAMLTGLPVTILGESPARFAASHSLEEPRQATAAELDFLLLNYFIPYGLIFDPEYLRWRLSGPAEHEIRTRHLAALSAQEPGP